MDVDIFQNKYRRIRVNGEIDYSNSSILNSALIDATSDHPEGFIIDLSDTDYIDSAGIHVILAAYHRLQEVNGKIVLILSNSNMKEIFDIISIRKFPNVFICENIEAAENALSAANESI